MPRHPPIPDSREAVQARLIELARGGRTEAAEALLGRWLEKRPNDYEMWLWLGDLRRHAGAFDSAVEALERASRSSGALRHAALLHLGAVHLETANARGAQEAFQRALACGPRSADARCGLAAAAGQLGDFESLRREASAAVEIDPRCYTAWYQLTQALDDDDGLADAMRRTALGAGDDPQAWLLFLAIGRVLERSGDYDGAFVAYTEGQRRRARAFSIDFTRQEQYFASVRRLMNAAFVQRQPARLSRDFRPIFIVGMPRSGTTLVEAILAAHPEVAAGGEMRFVYDWVRRNAGPAAETAVAWLVHADDATLVRLADEWLEAFLRVGGPNKRVTDKFPLNFTLVGLLALCFPGASVVHVRRDPLDTCVSCYTTALDANMVPATLTDLGACYRGYEALMEHWRELLGTERIVEIGYEDLVEAPEPAIRRLLAAVDLPWHPDCLAFHESARPVATASLYQVRQPIYRHSIGRWKRFEKHLGPLVETLNGPPRH